MYMYIQVSTFPPTLSKVCTITVGVYQELYIIPIVSWEESIVLQTSLTGVYMYIVAISLNFSFDDHEINKNASTLVYIYMYIPVHVHVHVYMHVYKKHKQFDS